MYLLSNTQNWDAYHAYIHFFLSHEKVMVRYTGGFHNFKPRQIFKNILAVMRWKTLEVVPGASRKMIRKTSRKIPQIRVTELVRFLWFLDPDYWTATVTPWSSQETINSPMAGDNRTNPCWQPGDKQSTQTTNSKAKPNPHVSFLINLVPRFQRSWKHRSQSSPDCWSGIERSIHYSTLFSSAILVRDLDTTTRYMIGSAVHFMKILFNGSRFCSSDVHINQDQKDREFKLIMEVVHAIEYYVVFMGWSGHKSLLQRPRSGPD
jgi:hypothetical protein